MLSHGEPPLIRQPLFSKHNDFQVQIPSVETIMCLNSYISDIYKQHHASLTAAQEYFQPHFIYVDLINIAELAMEYGEKLGCA